MFEPIDLIVVKKSAAESPKDFDTVPQTNPITWDPYPGCPGKTNAYDL